MKKIFFSLLFFFSPQLIAVDNDTLNLEALKEWIATKRALTIDERGGALSISADIHVEYIALSEQKNGVKYLGSQSLHPLIASDQFDIEFNFLLDYRTDMTWASSKLEYDNNMGIYGGTFDGLTLERAFFGFRLSETDVSTTDLEFGRRFLSYTFDSQIQFGALMDGILLLYNRTTELYGDFYLYAAPFVVSEIFSHISFVVETGLLNIYNTGFYAKYSLIDWATHDYEDERVNYAYNYLNSQFLLGYRFQNPFFDAVSVAYAAFLFNALAKPFEILDNRLDNLAGYIGISMGEIRKKNDWSLDFNVQFVQPQAIPFMDFSGIGIENPDNIGLYTLFANGQGAATIRETAVANSNYWGFKLSFLYALQDTITLSQSFSFTRPLMEMHNKFDFQKYKLELIYAL